MTVTTDANRVEAEAKITNLVEGQSYTLSFKSRRNTSTDARLIIRKNAKRQLFSIDGTVRNGRVGG